MKTIRFAIAQMNSTVGDYAGNTRKILQWIAAAEKKGADLITFPEAALSGYPVWDLANRDRFVREGLQYLDKIVRATRKKRVAVALGFLDLPENAGDKSFNALGFIQNGRLIAKQYKRLLPTYDVFLEGIFFAPGKTSRVIPWRGRKIGPVICEDIWDSGYAIKPLRDLKKQGADLFVNISASPYYFGVSETRDRLLQNHANQYRRPMLYVNQIGGQDDLIFDGRSVFVDPRGRILFRAPAFEEGLYFYDWDPAQKSPYAVPPFALNGTPEEIYRALVLGIRDYCRKNNFKKAVIGLSGGIDSALVAALAVDALGASAVTGVTMPGQYSSRGSWEDSEKLARNLGIEFRTHPIGNKYQHLLRAYQAQKRKHGIKPGAKKKITLAMENLQARLRGLELMYLSNDEGHLLLTTGNKSEMAMGYCTLYGDMAGGLCAIADVYKTDVYHLAWFRNRDREVIPKAILLKAPSAELRPNQKDSDSLPPYEILDEILSLYIERNRSGDEIARSMKKRGMTREQVARIIQKVDHNEYKRRQTAPVLRVSEKAWFGRRMPITNRYQH